MSDLINRTTLNVSEDPPLFRVAKESLKEMCSRGMSGLAKCATAIGETAAAVGSAIPSISDVREGLSSMVPTRSEAPQVERTPTREIETPAVSVSSAHVDMNDLGTFSPNCPTGISRSGQSMSV